MAPTSRASISVLLLAGLTAACASPAPAEPEPSSARPKASAVSSPSPADVVTGEFVIRNTTPGGEPARIETVEVVLESSSAEGASWIAVDAACDTQPPAPVSFDDRLTLVYSCTLVEGAVADGSRLRAVVEATIVGSDEVFRLESELAR